MSLGDGELVAGDMEGRSFPAVRGLDLDQTLAPVRIEAADVVAGAIAINVRHPANPLGEISSTGSQKRCALMGQHALFACLTKSAIAGVPSGDIVFTG